MQFIQQSGSIFSANQQYQGNDTETQVSRTLDGLEIFDSLTTQDLRHDLDIMHPAGRIRELRTKGYDIKTVWENCPTACGKIHRMARYVYLRKMKGMA
ncbi:helix-turn-helix domain-containing protein [Undibacterium sp. Di27W]|uniref:helix-turn-helix domain-containing protein n=1 Tax=Undibacterium sp. Di27W TaxID=3413036 RepID=UPI003BF25F3B